MCRLKKVGCLLKKKDSDLFCSFLSFFGSFFSSNKKARFFFFFSVGLHFFLQSPSLTLSYCCCRALVVVVVVFRRKILECIEIELLHITRMYNNNNNNTNAFTARGLIMNQNSRLSKIIQSRL